ncbi:MAG: hypothetical protein GY729_05780 [Desulfobacteraceae bacterium]|nr:hypothetical protein [Desulfobacteraceae bacterium]
MKKKSRVTCVKTDYFHGFMNEKSKNYDPMGVISYTKKLKCLLDAK